MRRFAILALALTASCSPGKASPSMPASPRAGWTVTEGMEGPESACYDAASGFLFVSQVAGEPLKKDGNGRVAKLDLSGRVLAANWVTGLNAPKGLRSHGGTLWASDIDEVVAIDIARGKVARKVPIPGSRFLNDVACGPDGSVYVSDMMLSRIYQVRDGAVTVFAEGEDLEYPNGLLVDGGRLVVAAWGKPSEDFSTPVPGRLFTLDLKTRAKALITPNPTGNLDGVESDGRGGFVVTDWRAGKVLHVGPDGTTKLVKQFGQGTADHAYFPEGRVLVLPHMLENKVAAYDLSEAIR